MTSAHCNGTHDVECILSDYAPIGLSDLAGAELLRRHDTKAIIAESETPILLESLRDAYRVLEVDGRRRSVYSTLYLDTERFDFYRDHHNNRAERFKVRYRTYVESDVSYFEVKHKTNKGLTEKYRVAVDEPGWGVDACETALLEEFGLDGLGLHPVITLCYERITLVAETRDERVTIDSQLSAQTHSRQHIWPDHVIVEVKQPRIDRESRSFAALADLGHRPTSVSKYCVGLATCVPDVKRNRFLRRLRRLGVTS